MVDVKFCGLTRASDAAFAAALGAAYAGVIFAGGPRDRTAEQAFRVWEAVPRSLKRVGVFGVDVLERLPVVLASGELDVVQLHGDPGPQDLLAVRALFAGEVWAVSRTAGAALASDVGSLFEQSDAVVLDAKVDGALGGTGERFDWPAVAVALQTARSAVRDAARLVVAGGLRSTNVAEAVRVLRPDVVDVSSGVESAPGIKDHEQMRAFYDAARERAT